MIAIAMGAYGDATAVAFGFSKAFNDGHTVVKMAGTYDSQQRAGASAGIGYQFLAFALPVGGPPPAHPQRASA